MLHAVVIGVDRYQDDAIPDLECAAADARALAGLLERRLATPERNVRVLVETEATRRNIMSAVGDLHLAVQDEDVVLLYFAGHGSPELLGPRDRRSRFLLPHDAELGSIYASGLDMAGVVPEWFERLSGAKLTVFVLDCCFSGMAGGRTVMGPLLRVAETKRKTLAAPPISLRGLKLGRGRVILCASDEDQVARESAATGHGIFTQHFLAALSRNRGEERLVRLTQLYDEVEEAVRLDTDGDQEPVITSISSAHASLPSLSEDYSCPAGEKR